MYYVFNTKSGNVVTSNPKAGEGKKDWKLTCVVHDESILIHLHRELTLIPMIGEKDDFSVAAKMMNALKPKRVKK